MTATDPLPKLRDRRLAPPPGDLAAHVALAIEHLEADPEDAVVAERLSSELGLGTAAAGRLVFLIPIAFARAEVVGLRLGLPRHYVLLSPRGDRRTLIPFLAEPAYREAARAAGRRLRETGRDAGFVAVASHSPEYEALQLAQYEPVLARDGVWPEAVARGEDDFSGAPASERRSAPAPRAAVRLWPSWLGGGRR